jgi:hypothetical protein
LPGRLEAVDPVPLVPELELELEEDDEVMLDDVVALDAAVRSLKRFCVPRIAPRLEFAPVALADELAVLVLVLGEEAVDVDELADEPEVEEPVLDELELEPDPEDDDPPPPPPPGWPLRFPASCGARRPLKRSAAMVPLMRTLCSRSETSTIAV